MSGNRQGLPAGIFYNEIEFETERLMKHLISLIALPPALALPNPPTPPTPPER